MPSPAPGGISALRLRCDVFISWHRFPMASELFTSDVWEQR